MSKNAAIRPTARLNSKSNLKHSRNDYPVEQEEMDEQKARLKKAAPAGKSALNKASVKVQFTPSPLAVVARPEAERHRRALEAAALRGLANASASSIVNVSFVLVRPGARRVSLCGEFNNWSPDAGPMIPHEDGRWEAIVALAPGRYEYKFFVDGEWLVDPVVTETVTNEFGSLNSVIEVRV